MKEEAELIKEWPRDAILKWEDNNLMCEFCGLFIGNFSNLTRHKKMHNRESIASVRCPDCSKDFFRSDNLTRHIRHYCPIAKIQREAKKPASIGQTRATNEAIQLATTTSTWKQPQWTLIQLDLPIDMSNTRRRKRKPTKYTTVIPLQNNNPIKDPRGPTPIPTPITDEDAMKLEKYLKIDTPQEESKVEPIITKPEILIDLRELPDMPEERDLYIDLTLSPVVPDVSDKVRSPTHLNREG